ncbi:hypothetical protein [Psychroserpens luteus]|uniref:Uncharacterized protein n=1 Tax=Psychroserpens luteus TaxID=1434066 RepID=A0ABW5ZTE3_9FLAO|nr:hypothetical protein [Psychroserpens luteus]
MKKIIFSLFIVIFVFLSCEQEDSKQINQNAELTKEITFDRLTSSVIGYEKDGKVQLGVSNEKVMNTFRKFTRVYSQDLTPQSFEVIEIDSKQYLRFHSEGNVVSTIALIKGDNGQYRSGSVVCETVACANNDGCIPEGNHCTKCVPDNADPEGPIRGDCKKTSGGPVIDP